MWEWVGRGSYLKVIVAPPSSVWSFRWPDEVADQRPGSVVRMPPAHRQSTPKVVAAPVGAQAFIPLGRKCAGTVLPGTLLLQLLLQLKIKSKLSIKSGQKRPVD